jgi:hypothetical protein
MSIQEMALRMPRAEKIRLMEALWTDLSGSEEEFESPPWHDAALKETGSRLKQGRESLVDWIDVKHRLNQNQ